MKLKDKVAIVTGSGRGIGSSIALRMAKEGASVVVVDIDAVGARKTLQKIKEIGGKAHFIRTDVSDETQVQQMVEEAKKFSQKVDILVNNAGVISLNPVVEMTIDQWDKVLEVNLKGTFLCCKWCAREMVRQKRGWIVNISSIAGRKGFPFQANYCASKFGMIGFTQSLALELAPHKIHVNVICPGSVDTEMVHKVVFPENARLKGTSAEKIREEQIAVIPWGRLGRGEDTARAVVFLCSEDAEYITGEMINVTGGWR